ncbi:MAG TPA: hypothetical protein VFQ35_00180 [Polyangiaceae bacterium]|nr:hypothetical protein [Polyangiaceae bacterium]
MLKRLACGIVCSYLVGCAVPTVEGGNNGNDRSNGGEQGEELLTGAMIVSPDGKWAVMQRNQTSVLLDIEQMKPREMPSQVARFVFAETGEHGVALLMDRTLVDYDLGTLAVRWKRALPFATPSMPSLLRLSPDGKQLLLADGPTLFVLDAASATLQKQLELRSPAAELTFVPDKRRALVVGSTRWSEHLPSTEVAEVDLEAFTLASIDVPNCTAPIAVLPDASRALLSPTFCEEGVASTGQQTWTNPDPVSIVDLAAGGPSFVKNLPGFGPVALETSGKYAVAYLDVKRMDASMFDDPAEVPSLTGPRYHVMRIDPKTLDFALFPIGEVLPRFALGRDGKTLLVDATVQQYRGQASVKASIDSSGHLTASFSVFGKVDSLFGALDLSSGTYAPFGGSTAALDRFVQTRDGKRVFTLKLRADGSGGDLYRIDLDQGSTTALNKSLRDIGLLADGETLLLRERLPAAQITVGATVSWYRRERYCLSLDGLTCSVSVDFQDSTPFQSGPTCTDYHDC